jgi:dTDP-4-dehydrorhamnose reductase
LTIVVLGRSGQVARALSLIEATGDQAFEFIGRDRCDMSDTSGMEKLLGELKPDAIINAAAYTAVDAAQVDQENARLINVIAPAHVAKLAHDWNVPFIHLSTDYVFDGTKDGPYLETDATNPVNVYGLTKRDGEDAVIASCPDAVVLRTSWVYSQFGKNFLRTMLTLAQTRDVLTVIDDQWGAPTAAADIAMACLKIALAKQAGAKPAGIFHMTGGGQTTWRGFAQAAFDKTTQWRGGKMPVVNPIKTADYPPPSPQTEPTPRPLNSRLNCDLLDTQFGIRLPHWEDSLDNTLAALENEFGAKDE